MAIVMPLVGYAVYSVVADARSLTSKRRSVAAGIGGYIGINAAALCAAIEFGVQPSLFYKTVASGAHVPLYAPFHLSQTIPAMLGAHLLVAGVVEFVLTAGVVAYLQRANVPILRINHPRRSRNRGRRRGCPLPRVRGIVVGITAIGLGPIGLMRSCRVRGSLATGTAKFGLKDPPDSSATATSGHTRCSPATTSRTARTQRSGTTRRR